MKKIIIATIAMLCGPAAATAQTKAGGISPEMLQQIQKEQQASPANRAIA